MHAWTLLSPEDDAGAQVLEQVPFIVEKWAGTGTQGAQQSPVSLLEAALGPQPP